MPYKDKEKQRTFQRDWAKNNRDPRKNACSKRLSQAKIRAVVDELKNRPCMDCGGSFPSVCMDFDHRPDTEKTESVANLIKRRAGMQAILDEIDKCDLVCANCHRIRTFISRDHKVTCLGG